MFPLRHHARRTGDHGRRPLYDWISPQTCSTSRQNRQTKLDDFKPYLHERWTEGCTNAWDPREEIKTHGYTDGMEPCVPTSSWFHTSPAAPATRRGPGEALRAGHRATA